MSNSVAITGVNSWSRAISRTAATFGLILGWMLATEVAVGVCAQRAYGDCNRIMPSTYGGATVTFCRYEVFVGSVRFAAAQAACAKRTFNGMQGQLAVVRSEVESIVLYFAQCATVGILSVRNMLGGYDTSWVSKTRPSAMTYVWAPTGEKITNGAVPAALADPFGYQNWALSGTTGLAMEPNNDALNQYIIYAYCAGTGAASYQFGGWDDSDASAGTAYTCSYHFPSATVSPLDGSARRLDVRAYEVHRSWADANASCVAEAARSVASTNDTVVVRAALAVATRATDRAAIGKAFIMVSADLHTTVANYGGWLGAVGTAEAPRALSWYQAGGPPAWAGSAATVGLEQLTDVNGTCVANGTGSACRTGFAAGSAPNPETFASLYPIGSAGSGLQALLAKNSAADAWTINGRQYTVPYACAWQWPMSVVGASGLGTYGRSLLEVWPHAATYAVASERCQRMLRTIDGAATRGRLWSARTTLDFNVQRERVAPAVEAQWPVATERPAALWGGRLPSEVPTGLCPASNASGDSVLRACDMALPFVCMYSLAPYTVSERRTAPFTPAAPLTSTATISLRSRTASQSVKAIKTPQTASERRAAPFTPAAPLTSTATISLRGRTASSSVTAIKTITRTTTLTHSFTRSGTDARSLITLPALPGVVPPPPQLAPAAAFGAAAVVSMLAATAGVAAQASMAQALVALAYCGDTAGDPRAAAAVASDLPEAQLEFPQSLLPGFAIGADPGAHNRGAVIAVLIFIPSLSVALLGIAMVVNRGSMVCGSHPLMDAAAAARIPGAIVVAVAFCLDSYVGSAVLLLRRSGGSGGDVGIVIATGILILAFVVAAVRGIVLILPPAAVHGQGRADSSAVVFDATGSVSPLPVSSRFGPYVEWLLFGQGAWCMRGDALGQRAPSLPPAAQRVRALFDCTRDWPPLQRCNAQPDDAAAVEMGGVVGTTAPSTHASPITCGEDDDSDSVMSVQFGDVADGQNGAVRHNAVDDNAFRRKRHAAGLGAVAHGTAPVTAWADPRTVHHLDGFWRRTLVGQLLLRPCFSVIPLLLATAATAALRSSGGPCRSRQLGACLVQAAYTAHTTLVWPSCVPAANVLTIGMSLATTVGFGSLLAHSDPDGIDTRTAAEGCALAAFAFGAVAAARALAALLLRIIAGGRCMDVGRDGSSSERRAFHQYFDADGTALHNIAADDGDSSDMHAVGEYLGSNAARALGAPLLEVTL